MLYSVNPYTGERVGAYPEHGEADVDAALAALDVSYRGWRRVALEERVAMLSRLRGLLLRDKLVLASLMTQETGKLTQEAVAEIEKCASACLYYAENAEALTAPETQDLGDGRKARVLCRPIGVVLAVMPWNFPFWQAFRAAVPNLLLGNVVALKHASNVQGCAEGLAALVAEAAPDGLCLLRNLRVPALRVREIVRDPRVAAVTLTGSEGAGRDVAEAAGACIKKTVLELGGSDAYLVLEDADVALAARACVLGRMVNAGQSCIAAKRFIVHSAVCGEFTEAVRELMLAYRTGDPADSGTTLAPLAKPEFCGDMQGFVGDAVSKGATLLCGGTALCGAFYPATLLADVTPGMRCFDEEAFGPVASIVRAEDETDAVRLANRTRFGLGGAVFSRDAERALHIASELMETGGCAVNDYLRSDPRLPFGGVKNSGYGRELSVWGVREFANVKTAVWQPPSPPNRSPAPPSAPA
jgi:succinate-semialdehyde dehydrogenase/glutarate-semialdehyde dehydrogenase